MCCESSSRGARRHFLLLWTLLSLAAVVRAKTLEQHEADSRVKSIPCPGIPSWFKCPTSRGESLGSSERLLRLGAGFCVSPSQLCDGRPDCADSDWDESSEVCDKRQCGSAASDGGALRCETGGVCLRVPHRHVCNGGERVSMKLYNITPYFLHTRLFLIVFTTCGNYVSELGSAANVTLPKNKFYGRASPQCLMVSVEMHPGI